MNAELVTTADGTHTLFVTELDEYYHSIHGALQESMHVFIDAGLTIAEQQSEVLKIVEIGFGTGLNCLLSYFNHHKSVQYIGVEAFPVEASILGKLNYTECLQYRDSKNIFETLHAASWQKPFQLQSDFEIVKLNKALQQLTIQDFQLFQQCNLIYFDAFAPSAQPEMWTQEIFEQLYSYLEPKGILVTYCAKGEVKRNMKAAGFQVETLPGPKGKREMTRCIKLQS